MEIETQAQTPTLSNTSMSTLWPWLMWLTSLLFLEFQFFLQLSTGVMLGSLITSLHTSAFGAGCLSACYYLVYVGMQTPAGLMVDNIGPRRLLSLGALVCASGCFLFANSTHIGLACVGRLLMGAGSSFCFVSTLYLISNYFPVKRFALMTGITETIGMSSTIVANIYFAHIIQQIAWQSVLYACAGFVSLLSILCFCIIRDKPRATNSQIDFSALKSTMWILLKQPWMWRNAIFAGLLYSPVTLFAALWGIPFLTQVQHVSLSTATFESGFVFIGIAIGAPCMGLLYPKIEEKGRFLMIASLMAAALTWILIYQTPDSILMTAACFLLLGFCISSYVFNYTIAKESVPLSWHATSIGFTNMICVGMGPLLQPVVGWLLQNANPSRTHTLHSVSSFHHALWMVPACLILTSLLATLLPKKNATI